MTHQTGPHGKEVHRLYIEDGSAIDREYYLSALVDRATSRVAFVASTEGGMDIEEVARTQPEKILSFSVDPATGFMPHHARQVAHALGFDAMSPSRPRACCRSSITAFVAKDMSLLEINPLVVTKSGELICLDAKIGFDDNALYRHPDIAALRDPTRRTPRRSRPRNTISITSRSTAPSAAWSTAPASPWRPWTSSSSMARRRRIFSMSAAAPPRTR